MTRILFVDDDPAILAVFQRLLRRHEDSWELVFACGGAEALHLLDRDVYDVVVTDMQMPGIDGATVLDRARTMSPDAVRIVLSASIELGPAMRAVPVAHHFLAKPCDPVLLAESIGRAHALRHRLGKPALREAVNHLDSVTSPPEVLLAMNAVLADPDASAAAAADVLQRDPLIAAKVLQLVNSAFFALPRHISSLREAVNFLGLTTLRNLVASVEAYRRFATGDPALGESFQHHAALVADAVRTLFGDRLQRSQLEEAAAAALLHDVGRLAMAAADPEGARRRSTMARIQGRSLLELELEALGTDHAGVGAYALSLWGLPTIIIEAVAWHHDAVALPYRRLDAVHAVAVADALVAEFDPGAEGTPFPLDSTYLIELGVLDTVTAYREARRRPIEAADPPLAVGD